MEAVAVGTSSVLRSSADDDVGLDPLSLKVQSWHFPLMVC